MSAFQHDSERDGNVTLSPPTFAIPPGKAVTLRYSNHFLQGVLYLLNDQDYDAFQTRFLRADLPPASLVQTSDFGRFGPWVLLHASRGAAWVAVEQLPGDSHTLYARGILNGYKEPSFVALTNQEAVYRKAKSVGTCRETGQLEPHLTLTRNAELIVALPSNRAFNDLREPRPCKINNQTPYMRPAIRDHPPLVVDPTVLTTRDQIIAASTNPRVNAKYGRPKRKWIQENLPGVMGQDTLLNPQHKIFEHRGNEWLLRRDIWRVLCHPDPDNTTEEEAANMGYARISAPYYQVLFGAGAGARS